MSKLFKSVLSLFLAVFMVASLAVIPSSAATAALSKTSISLTKGYQTTLSVTGATGSVTWSTGDKSIATVSSAGKVVGKGVGTTYIYAKTGSTTLKCKVTVVAAKITSSSSSVSFDKAGETKTVTITVKGSHSGVTVGSLNKNVASASWVRPVQWDGDKIKLTLTAKGNGSTRIKVYLKNYSSTCYKYIDVNVGDYPVDDDVDDGSDNTSSSGTVIMPYTPTINVASGETYTLQVYSTNQSALAYSISNNAVATVTAGTANGSYRNYTVKGVSAGTATLRIYDKNNTKKYSDITITVANSAVYYEIYTTQPTKLLSTDIIIKVPVNSTTNYFMLVPADYDPAKTNALFAKKLNKYSYYEVYDSVPSRMATGDTYKQFSNQNKKYPYGLRYILLPENYDEVKYQTAIAKYNEYYEYYTVYNEKPIVQDSWDITDIWTAKDASTGASVTRYMLLPYNYDKDKAEAVKNKDMESNNTYKQFTPYSMKDSSLPNIDTTKEILLRYVDSSKNEWFIIVPKSNSRSDLVKANDFILSKTNVYEYNVFYSTEPTAGAGEKVYGYIDGSKTYYILYKDTVDVSTALSLATGNYANGVKDD